MRKNVAYVVVFVLWVASLVDMLAVPACQTDPLFRLVECAFAFVVVPLLALIGLEKD